MPLKTLQGLLVGTAVIWALVPIYSAPIFLAFDLLLVMTALSKQRSAAKYVDSASEQLEKTMTPEGRAWVKQHAFHFVWGEEAKAYGTTLKMTSFMMMMLAVWWVVYAVIRWMLNFDTSFGILVMLAPALLVFTVGVTVGGKLEPDQLLTEDKYKDKKPLHDEAVKVVALLSTAGRWAPPTPP
jgi:hypothetical protein